MEGEEELCIICVKVVI